MTGSTFLNLKGYISDLSHLGSLHFEFRMIFSRRLAVLALLPAIAVATSSNTTASSRFSVCNEMAIRCYKDKDEKQ